MAEKEKNPFRLNDVTACMNLGDFSSLRLISKQMYNPGIGSCQSRDFCLHRCDYCAIII